MSSNARFLLHLASVAVSAFASLVLGVKLLGIAQDMPGAVDDGFLHTKTSLVLRAARTQRGQPLALGLFIAQVCLIVAFAWWAID